jgi:hypothetical protein
MPLTTSRVEPRIQENRIPGCTEGASKQAWLGWKDLAVIFLSGGYFTVFYRLPISSSDEGFILTPAERILRGQVPYRDFFSELAPGSFYLHAALFRLFGTDLAFVRDTVWLLGIILTWLLYRLSRKVLDGPASLLPPLIMASVGYGSFYWVSHHWWGVLFFMLMLLCLAQRGGEAVIEKTRRPRLRLFVAGLFAAAALLCMQSLGALALVTVLGWLLLVERLAGGRSWLYCFRGALGAASWFLMGTAAVMGPAVGYYWSRAALGAWVYDNFTFLFTNYFPYCTWPAVYTIDRIMIFLRTMLREPSLPKLLSFVAMVFFSAVAPAVALVGTIWQTKRTRTTDGPRAGILLLYLLTGFGCLTSQLHSLDLGHLLWGSPIILILVINAWKEAIYSRGWWGRPLIAVAGLALLLVVVGSSWRAARAASWDTAIHTRRGTVYANAENAVQFQGWVDEIERVVPEGGETFVFPYEAHLYYLTATRNPTRYDVLIPEYHSPEQFTEAMTTLWHRKPKYIFSCEGIGFWSWHRAGPGVPSDFPPAPLVDALHSGHTPYVLAAKVPNMEVWALK